MSDARITKEQVHTAFSLVSAVLYARLMNHLSLSEYNSVISLLKRSGLVKESDYLLTWVGPKKEKA